MLKEEYRRMNEQVNPGEGLKETVMQRITPRKHRRLRPAAAIAAVLAVVMMAVPVMAECTWILEQIAPELVEKLDPVQRSVTSNGITMEVVAASVKGNRAEMVVKIEGEALKESNDVWPSLVTNRDNLASSETYGLLDYEGVEKDRENGIYYYQVLMNYRKGTSLEEILAGEMTVSLESVTVSGCTSDENEVEGFTNIRTDCKVVFRFTEEEVVAE